MGTSLRVLARISAMIFRRVVIINGGHVLFDGSLEEVKQRYIRERLVKVTLASDIPLPQCAGVRLVGSEGLVHTFAFSPQEQPVQEVVSRLVSSLPVADISLAEPGIESVVRQLQLGTA